MVYELLLLLLLLLLVLLPDAEGIDETTLAITFVVVDCNGPMRLMLLLLLMLGGSIAAFEQFRVVTSVTIDGGAGAGTTKQL